VQLALGLMALIVLSVVIRVPFLSQPIGPDEGAYGYVAREWTGDSLLYRDIPFNRTPAIFLIYKVILAVIGPDVIAIRLGFAIYNMASLVALFFLSQAMFSQRAAWISTLAYAISSAAPHVEGFTANAEMFMTLPLILAAYWSWKEQWARAGLAAGLAFLLKNSGLVALPMALVWLVIVRASWRDGLRLLIAFSIGPLAVAAYGFAIGWHTFWTNFVEHTLLTNSFLTRTPLEQISNFVNLGIKTGPAWTILGVFAIVALLVSSGRTRSFARLWIISACAGMWMSGGTWNHYFFQLVAPLALLTGPGVLALRHGSRRWLWNALLILAFLNFITWELPLWFVTSQEASSQIYKSPPLQLAPQVASYVAAHTDEHDTIYVAFSQAQIYYLAHRTAQPAQMFWYEINHSPKIFGQVERAIRDREPAMIIWVQPPPAQRASYEAFEQLVQQGYVEAQRFGSGDPRSDGIIVYRRK
ncbi:MAG: hypothetical protein EHM39_13125, partial [Chloroflexi bacterium]